MAKVKGTNRRTRQKRSYTKPGSKREPDKKEVIPNLVVKEEEE